MLDTKIDGIKQLTCYEVTRCQFTTLIFSVACCVFFTFGLYVFPV